MFLYRLLLLGFCLLLTGLTYAQNREAATAEFRDASELLQRNNYKRAARSFRKSIQLDEGFIPAYRMLGLAEEMNGNLTEAAAAYEHVLKKDSLFSRLLYYQLGKVYYRLSKPDLAETYLLLFNDLQEVDLVAFGRNGDEERAQEKIALRKLANDIRSVRITRDSSQFVNVTEVYNLGPPINTVRDDYFPFFSNDLNSFYYTRQGELGDEDLIQGIRTKSGAAWTTNRFGNFNTLQPEGMCTLVRDGERIYFTLCHEQTSQGGCDLYAGWLIDGKVEKVEPLPNYINAQSWESQPAISCDGQQLYFASIRPGGLGGSDIYRCDKNDDGTWGEPKNLGDGVNTAEDEEGPFLSNDGQTLYFASMGHNSLGDQDIFMSHWDDHANRFSPAISLGPPVNGPHRELGFHLTSDGRTGYFASDRPGGRGGLDIYRFELNDRLAGRDITYVSGYVTDSLTGAPIADEAVHITGGSTYYSNYAGRIFICAPAGQNLPLTVNHVDYQPFLREYLVPQWENRAAYRIDLPLRRKDAPPPAPSSPVVVKAKPKPAPAPEAPVDSVRTQSRIVKRNMTVRFEFDDDTLLPLQVDNINKFVASVRNKSIVSIEVIGFTDDAGPEGYNIQLSQSRAKAVGEHLRRAGVTAMETRIIGMGEISGSGVRAMNRKVEVKVVFRERIPTEK